jgi:agmatine/peptidylarginine deiminase
MIQKKSRLFTHLVLLTFMIYGSLCPPPIYGDNEEEKKLTPEQIRWMIDNPDSLPIWMTPEEEARKHEIGRGFIGTPPPPAPVRQPAEFEPMTGVLIRYPLGISYDLVAEMSEDAAVWTIVANSGVQAQAESNYAAHGVNMDNCHFFIAGTNSYWTRDYGPWYIFTGSDEQGIVDHIYNRPRPDDDEIPAEFGDHHGLPVYGMDLIATGGNYMCDGLGVAMSTRLTYDENPGMTQAEVQDMLEDYCGITRFYGLPYVESGGIHHIDCWAKFLTPDKILVEEQTPVNTDLEANVAYLRTLTSSWGTPYEIVRVPVQGREAYTNSLILNHKILVPTFGTANDAVALQIYREAMPGYEVLGFDGSWLSDDAIHCRTMGIKDRYMLYIHHVPLQDTEDTSNDYSVDAEITVYSGQPLSAGFPELRYSIDGAAFEATQMARVVGDLYRGYIPAQPLHTAVRYYISARDDSGRQENHPYIGAPMAHAFNVGGARASRIVAGPGPAYENPPLVRVFPPVQDGDHQYEFSAYGASRYGVNVSTGRMRPGSGADIVTGAGPGDIYGPHVRGFRTDGSPLPGLSFLAYGTHRNGVNVSPGDIDGDGFDELITGAGPAGVFGPHVRAFDYDGTSSVTPVSGVSFFAYGTRQWGVNTACGDIDGDGFDEIITGAGPGNIFGPHARGWNVDGGPAAPLSSVSFFAYGTSKKGVRVSAGNVDGDGFDEIVTAPGPSFHFAPHIRGWNYDDAAVTPLPNGGFMAWPGTEARYGAKVIAGADLDGGGRHDIVVGGGPDPVFGTSVKVFQYTAAGVTAWLSLRAFPADWTHGVNVSALEY